MIKKIAKISDFPILSKVLDDGRVIVAKGRQNYSVYTKNIHGKKIINMSEIEAIEGERLNSIIFDMDDNTKKYFVVYNGEVVNTGEKRMVLHQLTRGQLGKDVIADGVNKRDFYINTR
jgi:hypothetical protein